MSFIIQIIKVNMADLVYLLNYKGTIHAQTNQHNYLSSQESQKITKIAK